MLLNILIGSPLLDDCLKSCNFHKYYKNKYKKYLLINNLSLQ